MILEIKNRFIDLIKTFDFKDEKITIKAKPLTVTEAIGNPEHNDYPIQKGKEALMQAEFKGAYGQAFTDMYGDFEGTLSDVLSMELDNNYRRAILISTINAVMRNLGHISQTVHCKDKDPVNCSQKLVSFIKDNYGHPKITLIGLQPRMLEYLTKEFDVRVNDMDTDFIGTAKFGVTIDPPEKTKANIDWCDLIVATGTTLTNSTISDLSNNTPTIFFGVTISGAAKLLGLTHFCSEST